MFTSTFISIGLHATLFLLAYFGLPDMKVIEPVEQPIDIVEDTLISNKTSINLGIKKPNNVEKNEKNIKTVNIKKAPPPPPKPTKKIIKKKNLKLLKKKQMKEVAELIKKKPILKPKNPDKKISPPKVVSKPELINKKQKEQLAKGILNTLSKTQNSMKKSKKDKNKNNKDVLKKIRQMAGNSNRQVQQTDIKLTITELDRIRNHVKKYWKVSYAASEVKMAITLKISTNIDGTVKSVVIYDKKLYQRDKFYRATADAARRAVLDSSPLPLPKGKEKKFQHIIMDFNTSFINSY